jgi:type IV pilus assembly protein PilV
MTARSNRGRAGFTLVSVLVAVMLLGVGLMAVSRALALSLKGQTQAALRSEALSVARIGMEQVRAADPRTLADEAPVSVDAAGRPAADGPFVRTVRVSERARNLVRVDVQVAYPRSATPVVLSTLVYR